ncbi:glycosyltransferase family protein [Saccharicrinis aurantiacus]|uniref:glycosyltransferase family protein n=1 Tax=Saccharicrinis aurantiacus TaxID=1849719 RepID=UPI002492D25C|nr:glycosyltransferase [Saccharicrinis aurantiacus]
MCDDKFYPKNKETDKLNPTKNKGIYLIQEPACLNPTSGAFQHIKMGLKHLGTAYNLVPYLGTNTLDIAAIKAQKCTTNKQSTYVTKKSHWLKGSVKDLLALCKGIYAIIPLIKALRKKQAQFIYERTSYLNIAGLVAAKALGIPHFYEANGLQFQSKKKYYNSLFTHIARYIEKLQYKYSTHTFFIGSYGNYWQLKANNWTNSENGIEKDLISDTIPSKLNDGKIHLVFVGSLMQHHRPDILKAALLLLNPSKYHLHLVGSKLDNLHAELLANNVPVTHHGFIKRTELKKVIEKFHIGIIAGSPEYQSCMKLFDYALANCAIVAPNVDVLKTSFDKELCFFNGSATYMANKIELLMDNKTLMQQYAKAINDTVKTNYTWENIFANKKQVISNSLL